MILVLKNPLEDTPTSELDTEKNFRRISVNCLQKGYIWVTYV